MGKIKEGDWVKTVEAHDYLDISVNEIGQVHRVGDKTINGDRELVVNFVDFSGDFKYRLGVAASDVKKLGKKLKHKSLSKLMVGDIIVIDGDHDDGMLHPEAYKVREVYRYGVPKSEVHILSTDTTTGEDFKVVVPEEDYYEKVPVIE